MLYYIQYHLYLLFSYRFFFRPLCYIVFTLVTKCMLCNDSFPEINIDALPINSGKMYLTFSFIMYFMFPHRSLKMLESITRNRDRKLEGREETDGLTESRVFVLLFGLDQIVVTISKRPLPAPLIVSFVKITKL